MKNYHKFVQHIVFPFVDIFIGTMLSKSYCTISTLNKLNRNNVEIFQLYNLRKLLKYAYEKTSYYNNLFKKLNITEFENFKIEDLKLIPKMTKKILKENYDDFISKDIANIKHKKHSTGGSTGEPLVFLLDLKSWSMTWAQNLCAWESIGYNIGDKMLLLGSSSIFNQSKDQKYIHLLFKQYPYSGVNMSDEASSGCIDFINKNRILFLYGYASALYMLSKYVLKNKIDLKLKGVFPTSEICPEYYKDSYKKAFNCAVLDCYGARDGGINAFQCKEGNYHLSINSIVMNATSGDPNNILVTDLFNYAMPFINYEVGDMMELSNDECNCGNSSYISHKIIGRKEDVIEFSTGDKITGPGWTILFKDLNVEKYRIVKQAGDNLLIQLVILPSYNRKAEEKIIFQTFKKNLNEKVKIKIEYLNNLVFRNNGKASYFIS